MNISKRIIAFACAIVMALGLSSAAFADHYAEKDSTSHERHSSAYEKSSKHHHSSHKKHHSEHHGRKDGKKEFPEDIPASEYDDMNPEDSWLVDSWSTWNEENISSDACPLFADSYTASEDIFADDYNSIPWLSEDYTVEEPEAMIQTPVPAGPPVLFTSPAEEEQDTALTIDLNDEAAVQELFQEFLKWMKENYTVPSNTIS